MAAAGDDSWPGPDPDDPWLTPADAGRLVGVSPQTINAWVRKGHERDLQADEPRAIAPAHVFARPAGKRPAHLVRRTSAYAAAGQHPKAAGRDARSFSPSPSDEVADLALEVVRLQDELKQVVAERDLLQREVSRLEETAEALADRVALLAGDVKRAIRRM